MMTTIRYLEETGCCSGSRLGWWWKAPLFLLCLAVAASKRRLVVRQLKRLFPVEAAALSLEAPTWGAFRFTTFIKNPREYWKPYSGYIFKLLNVSTSYNGIQRGFDLVELSWILNRILTAPLQSLGCIYKCTWRHVSHPLLCCHECQAKSLCLFVNKKSLESSSKWH